MFFNISRKLNELKEQVNKIEYESNKLKTDLQHERNKNNNLYDILILYIKSDIDKVVKNADILKALFPIICQLERIEIKEEGHYETRTKDIYRTESYSTTSHSAPDERQVYEGTETYDKYIIDKPGKVYFKKNSLVAEIIIRIDKLSKPEKAAISFIDTKKFLIED